MRKEFIYVPVFWFATQTSPYTNTARILVLAKELNTIQFALVANLAELHEWELRHAPLLSTLTGRHLYYRIAQQAIRNHELQSRTLKDLTVGSIYSEKALRIRIREMESEGYIAAVSGGDDARSKCLMPTEIFYESMDRHADQVRRIFEKDFLLFEKQA